MIEELVFLEQMTKLRNFRRFRETRKDQGADKIWIVVRCSTRSTQQDTRRFSKDGSTNDKRIWRGDDTLMVQSLIDYATFNVKDYEPSVYGQALCDKATEVYQMY